MKHVRKKTNKKRIWLVVVLVVVVAVLLAWGGKWLLDKRNQPAAKTQTTNQDNSDPKQEVTPNPNVPGGTEHNDPNADVKLIAPTGTFVSHHRPSVSGSGGPSDMFSSCTVETPGASCFIRFTQGTTVKQLEKKKVGAEDDTATWQWNINNVGLAPGDWVIEAVASYGDQELVTKDALPLQVKP